MIAIAAQYQERSDNMMGEHLPVILSSFLDMNHQELLDPECELCQRVPFE